MSNNLEDSMTGKLSRRMFLAMGAAAASPLLVSATKAQTAIGTRRLNNFMIAASDMDKSVPFYQKFFGTPTVKDNVAIFRIGTGPQFFGLMQARDGVKSGYVSYGVTVDQFDPVRTRKVLADRGATAEVQTRNGTPELWVKDPDNIKIQLEDTTYGHGSGPRGAVLPAQAEQSASPIFALRDLSHITLSNSNGPRTMDYYSKVFGWKVQVKQGLATCLGIGEGLSFIAFNEQANRPEGDGHIDHACVTIENFDANKVMNILSDNGIEPTEYGFPGQIRPLTSRVRLRQRASNGGGPGHALGTPELYFTDRDGNSVQIQDVTYCGGSGLQGQVCP